MKVRTRFAPSPTGFMHIGNLRTALYAYLYAKHFDGDFVIRIEDTDQERFVEGAIDVIFKTLKLAGIDYDEGPMKEKACGPYVQSQRKSIYMEYAKKLIELGGAYYCFCTQAELQSRKGEDGHKYDKHCLRLSKEEIEKKLKEGVPYVIRQNIPEGEGCSEYEDLVYGHISVAYADMEDGVLIKSDGMPTYNFANVVDDHLMCITHVLRGSEYLSSTPKYNLMYDTFGWERPQYMHLPCIMKDKERKLSKRYGDANFEDFVNRGFLPKAIVNYIALLGWSPKDTIEKMDMETLIKLFNVEGVNKSSAIFDEPKLMWMNGEYIKDLTIDQFNELAQPFYEKSLIAGKGYPYKKLSALLHDRISVFEEIPSKVAFLEEYGDFDLAMLEHKKSKNTQETAREAIKTAISALSELEWTEEALHATLMELAENGTFKKAAFMWSIRVAATGSEVTPGGSIDMLYVLGKDRSIERLTRTLERLNIALS